MKKALLVCYGAGHVNIMAPVLRLLLKEGRVEPVALALSVAKTTFQERSLPYKTVVDYAALVMDADAERYGNQLADRWHTESSGLTREESVVYLGSSMRDLVRDSGEAEAWRRLEAEGRQCFLPLQTLERIIRAEKPDVIATTNSPRMERAATLVGNRLGIPTLNVHDDLGFYPRDYRLTGEKIAVMSDITKENLVAQGHDGSKILVTGHPAFDRIPEEIRSFRRPELIRKLGLPGQGPYLLLGTSQAGRRGEIMDMCPLTAEAVAALGNYQLIVKPHPGEDAEAYRAYARGQDGRVTVVSGVSIREVLAVSELLITFASTIMIESLLMGKPVISLNLTGYSDPLPFVRWGLGVEARNAQELREAIRTETVDPKFRRQFAECHGRHFANLVDGKATQRITALIHRMAGVEPNDAV